ncbi:hypothetical protein IFM89_005310 [Coptis chinensis]|uniref:FAR1 domain-containing protein n=1 Tax=Coptis chinensis TaxID=261450 RepID=A0A835LLF3_9MAGN|nr:hypothetical protein IFM89_005310 [Coptis chinensis]
MTAWNCAALPVRLGQKANANRWMRIGLEFSQRMSDMVKYTGSMEQFLTSFEQKFNGWDDALDLVSTAVQSLMARMHDNHPRFLCSREGLKRKTKDSCNAILKIERKDYDIWVVAKFVKEHNHSTVTPSKVHYLRPRRHFAGAAKTIAETYQGVGVSSDGVMFMSMDGNRVSVEPNRPTRNVPPLQDYSKNPSGESEVKFQLSRLMLEPMLRSFLFASRDGSIDSFAGDTILMRKICSILLCLGNPSFIHAAAIPLLLRREDMYGC